MNKINASNITDPVSKGSVNRSSDSIIKRESDRDEIKEKKRISGRIKPVPGGDDYAAMKARLAKQQIINLNNSVKGNQKQSMATQKLINKTLKIKTQDNQEEQDAMTKRYFHIPLDKLAEAFEKQFLNGLPDFGQYTSSD